MRAAATGVALALAAAAARAECDLSAADCTTAPAIAPAGSAVAPSTTSATIAIGPGRGVKDCTVSSYVPLDPAARRSPLDPPATIDLTALSDGDLKGGRTLQRADYDIAVKLTPGWQGQVQATLTNRGGARRALALFCRYTG